MAAARLLMNGFDPYFIKEKTEDGREILRPSGEAGTPLFFIRCYPIAKLPYRLIRYLWFALSWMLLLCSIQIFASSAGSPNKSRMVWFVSLLFICGSYACRLHMERGQKYITYLFLLSAAYWFLQRSFKGSGIISGFILGFLTALRPTMIFMYVPLVIYKRWKVLIGSIASLAFGIALPIVVAGRSIWGSYIAAMREMNNFAPIGSYIGNPAHKYAYQLESMYSDMQGFSQLVNWDIPFCNTSFNYILRNYLSPQALLSIFILIILIVTISLIIYRYRVNNISNSIIFLVGIELVLLGDHFVPFYNFTYTNVYWVVPLSLIIISVDSLFFLIRPSIVILLLSLFFSIGFTWFGKGLLFGDLMMLLYLAVISITFLKRELRN